MHETCSLFTTQVVSLYYRLGRLNIKDNSLSTWNKFRFFISVEMIRLDCIHDDNQVFKNDEIQAKHSYH